MRNARTVLTLLFLFFLVACGSGDADEEGSAGVTPETSEPTEVAVATATDVPPTATLEPTATATTAPTATATTAPTATPEAVDSECVSCHADQELLVQIAEPEEESGESESSGPG